MQKRKIVYVLFSEKEIRYVKSNKNEVFYNIYGTFIPYYDDVEEEFRYNGKQIREIKKIIRTCGKENIYFLLGYDLDENGEFLSYVIEQELKRLKIDSERIIRTPATEKNFVLIKEKTDISAYIEYRKKDIGFVNKQKELGIIKPLGLLKAIGLYILYKKAGDIFKINKEGTSTFTFLIKYLKAKQ